MVFPAHIQSPGRSGNDRWQLLKFEMPRYDNSKLTGEARLRHVASLVWCAVDALLDGCTYGCPGKYLELLVSTLTLDPLDPLDLGGSAQQIFLIIRTYLRIQKMTVHHLSRPYSTNSTTLARL